ncbi:MAG: pirin family protein [Myxococcota bacterium]
MKTIQPTVGRRHLIGMGASSLAAVALGCEPGEASMPSAGEREAKMLQIRRGKDRFHTRLGWLDSRHTFSFGGHHHPEHMGFRALRVINDDLISGGAGFGTHGHRDMEILSYVIDGALEHKDSMGNGSIIRPGEVQRMTAGTGVLHSEYNALADATTRLLQVWILPERRGLSPGYEQKRVDAMHGTGNLRRIASRDGGGGTVRVHQDVELWAGRLQAGDDVTHVLRPGRGAWVQVARGEVLLGDVVLTEGDGAAIENVEEVRLAARSAGEVLLFDLGPIA